jgi:predicted acetyltransferase
MRKKTFASGRVKQDMTPIMSDPYPIRPITDDEIPGWRAVYEHAFHAAPAREPDQSLARRLLETDRSLAAFDPELPPDAGPVGRAGSYGFAMAVPGAVLPVAGVSFVSVLPTYRRRGILRSLMRRQLTDIAAKGEEPIAALWASEAQLYGRYGYGPASTQGTFRFHRGEGAFSPVAPVDPALGLRLAEPRAVVADLSKVYDSVLPGQPGFFTRSADWWERILGERSGGGNAFGPLRCVLAEDGSLVRGYALYKAAERWDESTGLPNSALEIKELIAMDPAAGAALWRDLLGRDLLSEVTAVLRPADDPVLHQLLDPRRARPQVGDGLWVRIINLPAALVQRAYSAPVDVVLEVTDELLPGNAGRWHLRARDLGDTACLRTSQPADITVNIRELGAAYLGGTRLGTLAAAGLVTEHKPGALRTLSSAMTWDPAPWCPRIF